MGQARRPTLTPTELTVLKLCAEGLSAKDVARQLEISPRTVEKHIDQARLKMRATNRAHLIALAFNAGLFGSS
jgi:LuxR family transcriptional regulator of spore coat protein